MSSFEWDKVYDVGVDKMNEEHRALIGLKAAHSKLWLRAHIKGIDKQYSPTQQAAHP
jgi:hemerythrin